MNFPFSKLRHAHGFVFLSGELPIAEDGTVPEGIRAQTALALRRIEATLAGAGLTLSDVVQVTVHLIDTADFAEFNAAYLEHFSAPLPTRTTVIAQLALPAVRVELTVVAAVPTGV